MKKFNKQILEAISRGIQLALDDYQDIEPNDSISHYNDVIDSEDVIHNRILYERAKKVFYDIIEKWDSGEYMLTKRNLKDLANISNRYGFKYVIEDNIYAINEAIDLICQVNPKADLNWFDMSNVSYLDGVFSEGNARKFNGDISKWDVSNVIGMKETFVCSKFNGDISQWNVSNVTSMRAMFMGSKFNGDISQWDVSKVEDMTAMFRESEFDQDISSWKTKMDRGINSPNVDAMFKDCPLENKESFRPI